ncbi:hypothetical protein INR49_016977 [Caranx melampygus]|nr:hypothetical protein INR49_016977 [Caranx melampygus]
MLFEVVLKVMCPWALFTGGCRVHFQLSILDSYGGTFAKSLCDMDCKADDALSFLMTENHFINKSRDNSMMSVYLEGEGETPET